MSFFERWVNKWNDYLVYLDELAAKEKVLVPVEDIARRPRTEPHLVFQPYDESDFPYNLNGNPIVETGTPEVDLWIKDFARLNIDIFEMIVKAQTLPDASFLKKRYFRIQRQVHPDLGGSTELSTEVNVAKESLDHLYQDPYKQITLFQTIFQYVRQREDDLIDEENDEIDNDDEDLQQPSKKPKKKKRRVSTETSGTASYIILYLVGAGLGSLLVLRWAKKKKSRSLDK